MATENTTHHSISALNAEGFTQRDNSAQTSLHEAVCGIGQLADRHEAVLRQPAGFLRITETTTRGTI
jgi:hypothetical protein